MKYLLHTLASYCCTFLVLFAYDYYSHSGGGDFIREVMPLIYILTLFSTVGVIRFLFKDKYYFLWLIMGIVIL